MGRDAAAALQAQLKEEWGAFKALRRRLAAPKATPPLNADGGGEAAAPPVPRSILKRAPAPEAPVAEIAAAESCEDGAGGGAAELSTTPVAAHGEPAAAAARCRVPAAAARGQLCTSPPLPQGAENQAHGEAGVRPHVSESGDKQPRTSDTALEQPLGGCRNGLGPGSCTPTVVA